MKIIDNQSQSIIIDNCPKKKCMIKYEVLKLLFLYLKYKIFSLYYYKKGFTVCGKHRPLNCLVTRRNKQTYKNETFRSTPHYS